MFTSHHANAKLRSAKVYTAGMRDDFLYRHQQKEKTKYKFKIGRQSSWFCEELSAIADI
jgi:hypothetical protein